MSSTPEVVERLARCLDGIARQTTVYASLDRANAKDAAATLRALLAERDRLAAEVEKWKRAAVLAAAPLEAMCFAGSTYLHAEEVRSAINEGVAAVRAALAGEGKSND